MNKPRIFLLAGVLLAVAAALVGYNLSSAATHTEEETFQNNTYFESVTNWFKKGIKIGRQNTGGVTFFNGTIVNSTTKSGKDNPVTVGDNLRVDGAIWRTEEGGSNPLKVADTIVPNKTGVYSLGSNSLKFKDAYFSGAVKLDSIDGDGVITGDNIAESAELNVASLNTTGDITQERAANGAVKLAFLYNASNYTVTRSFGGTVTVVRNSAGDYTFTLPFDAQDRYFQVTPSATNAVSCTGLLNNPVSNRSFDVHCFALSTGAAAESYVMVTFF